MDNLDLTALTESLADSVCSINTRFFLFDGVQVCSFAAPNSEDPESWLPVPGDGALGPGSLQVRSTLLTQSGGDVQSS